MNCLNRTDPSKLAALCDCPERMSQISIQTRPRSYSELETHTVTLLSLFSYNKLVCENGFILRKDHTLLLQSKEKVCNKLPVKTSSVKIPQLYLAQNHSQLLKLQNIILQTSKQLVSVVFSPVPFFLIDAQFFILYPVAVICFVICKAVSKLTMDFH